jgi:hypothetical protein
MSYRMYSLPSLVPILALGTLAAPAAAQTYLPPENAARSEMFFDNPFCGGQPSDLEFELVEPPTYGSKPCSTGQREILEWAEFKVKVKWKSHAGGFMLPQLQAEGSGSTNGDDKIIIEVFGGGHWAVAAVKRETSGQPVDCLGTATPEAEQGGSGGWEGVKLTPPSRFESGQYNQGNGADPRELTYTIKLIYLGNEDGCNCSGFLVRGRYIHTYDGSIEVGWSNTYSIGVSYPWSVSIGSEFTITDDHAWTKQLVDPTGNEHVRKIDPPPHYVPREECCESSSQSRPPIKIDPPVITPTGHPATYRVTTVLHPSSPLDECSQTVEMIVRTRLGFEVSRTMKEIASNGEQSIDVDMELVLPPFFGESSFLVELLAIDEDSSLDTASGESEAFVGPSAPTLSTALMGGDALIEGDTLMASFRDPSVSAEQAAFESTAIVFDAAGTIVDTERGVWSGEDLYPAMWASVVRREEPVAGDGVLSVVRGDTVAVEYRSEFGVLGTTIEVIRDPEAVLDCTASHAPGGPTAFSGVSGGGTLVFEIQRESSDCRVVQILTFEGMTAASVSTAFIKAMRDNGLLFISDSEGFMRLVNTTEVVRCRPVVLDPGLDLYSRA